MGTCSTKKLELVSDTINKLELDVQNKDYKAIAGQVAQFYIDYEKYDAQDQKAIDGLIAKTSVAVQK